MKKPIINLTSLFYRLYMIRWNSCRKAVFSQKDKNATTEKRFAAVPAYAH